MYYQYAHPELFQGVPKPNFAAMSGNLVIYGAGFQGLLAAHLLKSQKITVLCFGDQDVKKQGTTYYGLPVYSPEEMKRRYPDAVPIVTPYSLQPAFMYVKKDLGYENAITPFSLFLEFDSSGFDDLPEIPDWYHPESLPFHIDMFFRKCLNLYLDMSFFSLNVCVTEACNLRCKNCTSLMPSYSKPRHFELDEVFQDISAVLDGRCFYYISIEGGETFLWKPLPDLLDLLCKKQDLMEIVLITNGTILPDVRLLKSLRNPKITVRISDYGKYSRMKELIPLFAANQIRHWVLMQKWYELATFHREELVGTELRHVVTGCCKLGGRGNTYLADGKLYRCPVQGNLHRLEIFESDPADYVDLRQPDKKKMQEEISEFINVKKPVHITKLCRHCNGRGYTGIEVPPAEQLALGEQIQVRFE